MQPRHRLGVAIGDQVLDLSVVAPVFFTGPVLSANQQVRLHLPHPHLPHLCMSIIAAAKLLAEKFLNLGMKCLVQLILQTSLYLIVPHNWLFTASFPDSLYQHAHMGSQSPSYCHGE